MEMEGRVLILSILDFKIYPTLHLLYLAHTAAF